MAFFDTDSDIINDNLDTSEESDDDEINDLVGPSDRRHEYDHKNYDRSQVTIDLHLNSPIVTDDVDFIYNFKDRDFICLRHKKLKTYLDECEEFANNNYHFADLNECPWEFIENLIKTTHLPPEITNKTHRHNNLTYLVEAALLNCKIHHEAYYGQDLNITPELQMIKDCFDDCNIQSLYNQKVRVERIKEYIGKKQHRLGHFCKITQGLRIEKEISLLRSESGKYYVFPTSMVMCVMDNLQAQFYLYLHVVMKQEMEKIPQLKEHYWKLHNHLKIIRQQLGNSFFDIMKDWDAFCIGNIVRSHDDLGFAELFNNILAEWRNLIDNENLVEQTRSLFLCDDLDVSRDERLKLSLYFSNLNKSYGHPILKPEEGVEVIRENAKKHLDVDSKVAKSTLWLFRRDFIINFYKKRGHYPNYVSDFPSSEDNGKTLLEEILSEKRLPTKKELELIPLSDWDYIYLTENFSLNHEIDEREILKDTACAPNRYDWFVPYDGCAFKHLYNQKKPKSSGDYEPRVLARYLKGEPAELAKKVWDQLNYFFNHKRDDIVQLCRKEQELNKQGRCYCKQTYLQRMMQVMMEKAVADNILPFIREQTMTNSELEVTKRMDTVASSIGNKGNYNLNLDLSKWNQLQRDELNKYIFEELDSLHGVHNLFADSHRWFGRCVVLLNSRLTPPRIGDNGEPEPGPYCHYNQLGGFEGMRQKSWTITTIMIIKLALLQNKIEGHIMGQGDNQVIHVQLNDEQNYEAQKTIQRLLNTLDYLFNAAGLKLKLSETWYSKNLFEYSKIRFFKGDRIDDTLKRLRRMISDINEGFPSLNSHLTTTSTCSENLSRNSPSPLIPFFLCSLESGNIMSRKQLLNPRKDKDRLLILLNIPNIFGGLPISNLYQHAQRGWSDPIPIWLHIWGVIKRLSLTLFSRLLHVLPMKIKDNVDPISIVEDIYSLNITRLPNFEREARNLVERKLKKYVTNPKIQRYLGSTRDDLQELCSVLIQMRPFIANLAHEILRNSNEGIKLQIIGSFTNVSTINKLIFCEKFDKEETIYHIGMKRDHEAISTLRTRLETPIKTHQIQNHLITDVFERIPCTLMAAEYLREKTWGFKIEGISSPVPCEQFAILNYDQLPTNIKSKCILAKTSSALQSQGKDALKYRGPYPPYFGSPTSDKVLRPKLTVINSNEDTKSIKKLYYMYSFLIRISPNSGVLTLIEDLIKEKLKNLPIIFQQIPLEDWCGRNYGGSYEHRFKASSQKRSALYSLKHTAATHINMNTNKLGLALRGNEDYNIFFQEIFLYIQNYISEIANLGYQICDTYGVFLHCENCTYLIKPHDLKIPKTSIRQSPSLCDSQLLNLRNAKNHPLACFSLLAVSVYVGRSLSHGSEKSPTSHSALESAGLVKDPTSEDNLLSSNLMSEFRDADLTYILVGIIQASHQAFMSLENNDQLFPNGILDHLSYLVINSGRLSEIFQFLEISPKRHAEVTQIKTMSRLLFKGISSHYIRYRNYYLEASSMTHYQDDEDARLRTFWGKFLMRSVKNKRAYLRKHIRNVGRSCSGDLENWVSTISKFHTVKLKPIKIPCDFSEAITFWRDNKGCGIQQDLPLKDVISKSMKLRVKLDHDPKRVTINPPLYPLSTYHPGPIVESMPPLWSKWIHHTVRLIGNISTAASKMMNVLRYIDIRPIKEVNGLIITLAEGSGSILSLLMHVFPNCIAMYNTLQKDTVEIKSNFLNIDPPALMGDPHRLVEKLIGTEDLNLGETDILQPEFVYKLEMLAEQVSECYQLSILSIDAETKTDTDNFDKLEVYVQFSKKYLSKNGFFINKMFIYNRNQFENLNKFLKENQMSAKLVKPYGSHPDNHEVYLICWKDPHSSSGIIERLGQYNIIESWLRKSSFGKQSSTNSRPGRISYLTECLKVADNMIRHFQENNNFCLWWSNQYRNYNILEIGPYFFQNPHIHNMICLLLSIDPQYTLYNEFGNILPSQFVNKSLLISLIILAIAVVPFRKIDDVIYILDSLSCIMVNLVIIPGGKIDLSFDYVAPNREDESVIGVIGDRMKDIMRSLSYHMLGYNKMFIPSYYTTDNMNQYSQIPFQIHENLRLKIKSLKLNTLNAYLLKDSIDRR